MIIHQANGSGVTNENSLFGYAFTATATFIVKSPTFTGHFEPVLLKRDYLETRLAGFVHDAGCFGLTASRHTDSWLLRPMPSQVARRPHHRWSRVRSRRNPCASGAATVPSPPLLAPLVAGSIQSTRLTLSWYGSPDDGGDRIIGSMLQRRNTSCVIVEALPSCTVYHFLLTRWEAHLSLLHLVTHTAQSVTTLRSTVLPQIHRTNFV